MKEVTAAIVRRQGRVLIGRRGPGGSCAGLWEFPGGKREPGETAEDCAVRECREELGVDIAVRGEIERVVHRYPDGEVRLTFLDAVILRGEPEARVHSELAWAAPGELERYAFCPADAPLIRRLAEEKAP